MLRVTHLEIDPDFVSWFGGLHIPLLKPMGQGSQDTGRSLLQRTLTDNLNISVGSNGHPLSATIL